MSDRAYISFGIVNLITVMVMTLISIAVLAGVRMMINKPASNGGVADAASS